MSNTIIWIILVYNSRSIKVIDISYEGHYKISMCDFIDYEIYDKGKIKNKCLGKEHMEEVEKIQEKPTMVTQ